MNREYVVMGGVPTKVLTLGTKGISDKPKKKLMLIIPGE